MGQGFGGREVWSRTRRAVRRLTPHSREGRLLAVLWALAALVTLSVALAQSLPMFLASFAAVTFGTYAALWLMGGLARR